MGCGRLNADRAPLVCLILEPKLLCVAVAVSRVLILRNQPSRYSLGYVVLRSKEKTWFSDGGEAKQKGVFIYYAMPWLMTNAKHKKC